MLLCAEGPRAIARDYRINRQIRAREVRLIGDQGEQVGVIPLQDALKMAEEADFDLVEVATQASPPVVRILDYGKFRYEQSKKERESKKTTKNVGIREVRMRPRIDEHDIAFKSRMVKKFLGEGHKVKMSVLFRGREITHPELALKLMRRVAEALEDMAKLEKAPSMEGRMMTMILAPGPAPKKGTGPTSAKKNEKPAAEAVTPLAPEDVAAPIAVKKEEEAASAQA